MEAKEKKDQAKRAKETPPPAPSLPAEAVDPSEMDD